MPYAERAWTNQKVVDRVWQVFVIDRQPANGAYYAPRLNAVGCAIGCLLPPSVAKGLDPVDEWLIGDFIFIGGVLEPGFRGRGAPMLRRWFAECDPALLDALQAWHDKLTAGETATDEDADRLLEYLADHYDIVPTQVAIERAFYRAGNCTPGPLQESERDQGRSWFDGRLVVMLPLGSAWEGNACIHLLLQSQRSGYSPSLTGPSSPTDTWTGSLSTRA